MYKVPEHLVVHYGILLMIITVFMPMYILDKQLNSTHYFNNFIIFDVLYYIVFEKLNFTNNE
jgi:C4-dicarboxylate transporter